MKKLKMIPLSNIEREVKEVNKPRYCAWCRKKYYLKDVVFSNDFGEFKAKIFCSRNCYYDDMGSDPVYDGGGNTY